MGRHSRAAAIAALAVFAAFAVHRANMLYFEPRMGFRLPTDYLRTDLLEVGLQSDSWIWSGYAHFVTGLATVVIAAFAARLVAPRQPLAARLLLATGVLAAFGFVLTGGIDLAGRRALWALNEANPGNLAVLVAGMTLSRVVANSLALTLLGWFVLHFTWCARSGGQLPFLAGLLGYVTGVFSFLVIASLAAYGLAYVLVPAWALVTGLILWRRADTMGVYED